MKFEKEERNFQEIIQSYGFRIQELEKWRFCRKEAKKLATEMRESVARIREYLEKLRASRWKLWKLENETTKTYFLMVSEDCGLSYYKQAEGTNINELLKQGEKFDKLGLRWSVEDKDGNLAQLEGKTVGCKIHNDIISHFKGE